MSRRDLAELNEILGADYFITGNTLEFHKADTLLEIYYRIVFQYRVVDLQGKVRIAGNYYRASKDEKHGGTAAALRGNHDNFLQALAVGMTYDAVHYFVADSDTYKDEMEFLDESGQEWITELGDSLDLEIIDD